MQLDTPLSGKSCRVSKFTYSGGMEYGCEICYNFRIDISRLWYVIKHKFDDHTITLRYPPFFYEGVFYGEVCEEAVNNQQWLYHCGESDHSFHSVCLRWQEIKGQVRRDHPT